LLLLAGGVAYAQPAIGVWNAASSDPYGKLAPGSLVRVALKNPPFLFAFDPSDVSVELRTAGADGPRTLTLINFGPSAVLEALLPSDAQLGPASLTLTFGGQTSAPFAFQVVDSNFGLFTVSGGVGPARASVNGERLTLTNPARPGDEVTLEGTGLGRADVEPMAVMLGGKNVPISGITAGVSPGLDRVRFFLPQDAAFPDGCYVKIAVAVGDSISNSATVPTARSGLACAHPFGLSFDEMRILDSGGELAFGTATISSQIAPVPPLPSLGRFESAGARFLAYNAVNVALAAPPLIVHDASFGCKIDEPRFGNVEGFSGKALNLGDSLILEGQDKHLSLDGGPPFFRYGALVSNEGPVLSPDELSKSYFSPGIWRLSSADSAAASRFAAEIRVPPQPRLLDFAGLTVVDRTKDLHVAWASDGYEDSYVVDFEIASGIALAGLPGESTNHRISCRSRAADGGLIIPASSLEFLAVSQFASLMIGISSSEPVVTSFPMVNSGVGRSLLRFAFVQRYSISVK